MNPDDYKKSPEEIRAEMAAAAKSIKVGGTYQHYKGYGTYRVMFFAIREEDNELCVIYQRVDQPDLRFIRPVTVWLESVEWQGQTVQRFKLVD